MCVQLIPRNERIAAPACLDYGLGTSYQQFTATPSSWTQVTFSYTANYTNPLLLFGIETASTDFHYIDTVSVVDPTVPSVELLQNGGFDNSTVLFAGWSQWCAFSCYNNGNTNAGECYTGYPCGAPTNRCLQGYCSGRPGIFFIGQSFPAVIGRMYTVSFWHIHVGSGTANQFYVDVV